jgi:hypothetical protein
MLDSDKQQQTSDLKKPAKKGLNYFQRMSLQGRSARSAYLIKGPVTV